MSRPTSAHKVAVKSRSIAADLRRTKPENGAEEAVSDAGAAVSDAADSAKAATHDAVDAAGDAVDAASEHLAN